MYKYVADNLPISALYEDYIEGVLYNTVGKSISIQGSVILETPPPTGMEPILTGLSTLLRLRNHGSAQSGWVNHTMHTL